MVRWIYADPRDPEAPLLELFVTPGVADQLPVAVRSPVSPVEHEDQRPLLEPLAEVERPSLLVRQLEVLHLLAVAQATARLGHFFSPGCFLFRIVPERACRYSGTHSSARYGVAKANSSPLPCAQYG